MTATMICALLCAILYLGLLAITLLRRPMDRTAIAAAAACALTLAWAVALGFPGLDAARLAAPLDAARIVAWTALLTLLLEPSLGAHPDRRLRNLILATPLTIAIAVFCNDALYAAAGSRALAQSQIIGRESTAIFGLLLVENLYRNTAARRQWNLVPLATAMGGLFAYQLFLNSDGLLFGAISAPFAAAQPATACLIAPFLGLSLFRNRGWKVKVHVSQRVVLHSLTFIASGIFLVAIVTVANLLHDWGGGRWGEVVELTTLFGSVMVLATIVSSGSLKARLKYLVSRNFFALRYDYRREWMSFIDLLSTRDAGEDLKRRAIEGVANVVDAPAGALWLAKEGIASAPFVPVAVWNMRLPSDAAEPSDSDFVKAFRGGYWIQEFHRGRAYAALGDCWLAVPLANRSRLIGFITLARSRAPVDLTWESFELLRALARQAASYIDEERSLQQLQDANRFHNYAQRFAFVAHDIKSLAAQLRLVTVNAERHGDDPAFRADMFATIRHSVARMNELLQQLRANEVAAAAAPPVIDAVPVIRNALAAAAAASGIAAAIDCTTAPVAIEADSLVSAIKHLLDNAREASPASGKVALAAHCGEGRLVIDIADDGAGMDVEFIHGQLFRPFHSTKPEGHGIGAYQTRELLRRAGGDLQVASAPGAGTTMRIILPLAKEGAVLTAA